MFALGRRAGLLVLAVTLAVPVAVVTAHSAEAAPSPKVQPCTGETHLDDSFPCLGEINLDGFGLSVLDSTDLFVNPGHRLLVTGLVQLPDEQYAIAEFPLDSGDVPDTVKTTPIHDPNSSVPVWAWSPTQSPLAYDAVHHRIFVSPGCGLLTSTEGALCAAGGDVGRIRSVDLVTGATSTFEFPMTYSGQRPRALSYDPTHDVLYVGTQVAFSNLGVGLSASLAAVGTSTSVHAIDASELLPAPGATPPPGGFSVDDDAAHLWSYDVDACPSLLTKGSRVVAFGVSRHGSFLHFACKGTQTFLEAVGLGDAPLDLNWVRARASGVMHIDLLNGRDPREWDPRDEPPAPVSFFPSYNSFPGNTFWGEGGVSATGEHLFLTPGGAGDKRVFIFDGRTSAWTGTRPMPTPGAMTGWVSDPASGRAYLTDAGGMYIVDTAVTPVPQGEFLSDIDIRVNIHGAVDAATRRVFIPKGAGVGGIPTKGGIRVFRDQTGSPPEPQELPDPDDRTHDIDEDDAGSVTHTGAASAYGARAILVGGRAGLPAVSAVDAARAVIAFAFPRSSRQFDSSLRLSSGNSEAAVALVDQSTLSGDRERGTAEAKAVGLELAEADMDELGRRTGDREAPRPHKTLDGFIRDLRDLDPSYTPCDAETEKCDDFDENHQKFDERVAPLDKGFDDGASRLEHGDPKKTDDPALDQIPPGDEVLTSQVEPFTPQRCVRRSGDDENRQASDGVSSGVACAERDHPKSDEVTAWAGARRPFGTDTSVAIGSADSWIHTDHVPGGGIVSRASAAARDIVITAPQGTLVIGEVRGEALAQAAGRPGTARSRFDAWVSGVRITPADGSDVVVACDTRQHCNPRQVAGVINQFFANQVQAFPPRRDTRDFVTGSDGGAQALVTKDPEIFFSDLVMDSDSRQEVWALKLEVYNDGARTSRVAIPLGAVRAEAKYEIGEQRRLFVTPPPPPPPARPPAPPAAVPPPAAVEITLTDDTPAASPLPGASFALSQDTDGDGRAGPSDTPRGSCVTDSRGFCSFKNLALGRYVVAETQPPPGYQPADDIAFALTSPGQMARIAVVNGLEGSDATVAFVETAFTSSQTDPADDESGGRLVRIPRDLAEFLLRNPGQALLFALVWFLVGAPAYLALRRRDLVLTREHH